MQSYERTSTGLPFLKVSVCVHVQIDIHLSTFPPEIHLYKPAEIYICTRLRNKLIVKRDKIDPVGCTDPDLLKAINVCRSIISEQSETQLISR